MRRDKKIWIGILAVLGLLAPLSNAANALNTKNNLSQPALSEPSTAKAVFLVSKPESLVKVKKNLQVLHKSKPALTPHFHHIQNPPSLLLYTAIYP